MRRALIVAGLVSGFVTMLAACATSPLGRKQLLLVGDQQMDQMGAEAFTQLKAQTPVESNAAVNAYVRCVAQPITEAARGRTQTASWEIVVFRDETANAFALPGGKIGVHTGLLKVAKNEAQLAAVLGHEVGHVIAKHSAERVSEQTALAGGLSVVEAFISGGKQPSGTNQLLMAALGLGAQVGVALPHSRTQESEADLIGLDLMSRVGFDPRQSVELWKNMGAAAGGGAPPEFLSTHPGHDTRIAGLQGRMAESVAKYEQARAAGARPQCQAPR